MLLKLVAPITGIFNLAASFIKGKYGEYESKIITILGFL
jgi:hypothetical protein